ncbi:ESX secretion-associated protein EspG, partial [Corallococcus sp. AB030]
VFYTRKGRIVAAPSASPSGQLWTTLKPGSDHAIGQAIHQLVEISTDQWEASLV